MIHKNDFYPARAKVEWIGLRPDRNVPQQSVQDAEAEIGRGLIGDRYKGKNGARDVTLIQSEHLDVVGKLLNRESIDPSLVRRNIVVSGVNLISLKGRIIQLGSTTLEITGACAPCSKMEKNLGPGGYNAMRGHGGITSRVVKSGTISVGDTIEIIESPV